jgi:hypothetical protein
MVEKMILVLKGDVTRPMNAEISHSKTKGGGMGLLHPPMLKIFVKRHSVPRTPKNLGVTKIGGLEYSNVRGRAQEHKV